MKALLVFLVLISGMTSPMAWSQDDELASLFQWEATITPASVAPGDEATITVSFTPEPEHFIYDTMTSITVQTPDSLDVTTSETPTPIDKMDPFENVIKKVYDTPVTFSYTIQVSETAQGTLDIPIEIAYQGCSPEICYFPTTLSETVSLQIESTAVPTVDDPFLWNVLLSQTEVAQGSSTFIEIQVAIAEEHYIYRDMTTFRIAENDHVIAADAMYPDSITYMDPFQEAEKEIYPEAATFRVPVTVLSDAPIGESELMLELGYQGCSPEVCFFPETLTIPIAFTITEGQSNGAPITAISSTGGSSSESGVVEGWLSQGLLITFVLAYLFGLATCATPCVYPLIPITITIFGARETKNVFHAFTLAATYVAGIAIMYSMLGLTAAYTGAIFGSIMSNPWVIGGIAAVFIGLGLSMMGLFELKVPGSVQAKLTQVGGKGYTSAYMMGTVAGVIAAPCTGPVLAGILTYVAAQGSPAFGFFLLLIYALGLGTPFVILGTFSGMVNKIPRSGAWMESVKSVFGIILFVAALYYLKDVVPALKAPLDNSVMMYVVSGILLIAGLGVGAVHLSFHAPSMMTRVRKGGGILVSVVALYLTVGSMTVIKASEVDWTKNLDEGLALARENQQPVMIDFSADWCNVCHEIEATTFSDPAVGDALEEFVTIKIDMTRIDETAAALQKEFDITGLPFIYFIDSSGTRLDHKTIRGYIGSESFIEHISDIG